MAVTIVAVDDDPSVAAMLEVVLRLEGLTVYLAADAEEALELCRRVQADVAVIDVMMPGTNGWELARQLRAHPDTAGIGIVFYSALETDGDVWAGWQAGADSYVPKSSDVHHLADEVRRVAVERGAVDA